MYFDERENYFTNINEDKKYLSVENNEYINNEKHYDYMYNIENLNINNFRAKGPALVPVKEGLNRGNMFKDEYSPYKDYYYKVVVHTKRDELLLKIQELNFAAKDLNLYLDIYPKDLTMLETYKRYVALLNDLKREYERNYGPLFATDVTSNSEFTWINNPWPWNNGGVY